MKKIFKWIGIAFAAFVALIIVIGVSSEPTKKTTTENAQAEVVKSEPEIIPEVTSAQISKAYEENTVAADQQFKGKKFKVSGVVADINTNLMGEPYLVLKGGSNPFMQPQFTFDKSSIDQLAKLKKGVKITMTCTGKGDVAKTPMSDSCVLN